MSDSSLRSALHRKATAHRFGTTLRVAKLVACVACSACAVLAASSVVACKKGGETTVGATSYAVGDKIEVEWKGSYYQAEILSKTGGLFRVHYIGFGTSWDENVTTSRMRAFTGKGKVGP